MHINIGSKDLHVVLNWDPHQISLAIYFPFCHIKKCSNLICTYGKQGTLSPDKKKMILNT